MLLDVLQQALHLGRVPVLGLLRAAAGRNEPLRIFVQTLRGVLELGLDLKMSTSGRSKNAESRI